MEESIRMLVELVREAAPYLLMAAQQKVTADLVMNAIVTAICAVVFFKGVKTWHGWTAGEKDDHVELFCLWMLIFTVVGLVCLGAAVRRMLAPDFMAIKTMISLTYSW